MLADGPAGPDERSAAWPDTGLDAALRRIERLACRFLRADAAAILLAPTLAAAPVGGFNAETPLVNRGGAVIGALRLHAAAPREPLSAAECAVMDDLAAIAVDAVELQREAVARQRDLDRFALRDRLLGVVAEAPSFTVAVESAMAVLREATQCMLCLFFRLEPDGAHMQLVAGQASTSTLTEAFLAHVRHIRVRTDNSLVGLVAATGEQQIISGLDPGVIQRFPAISLSVAHNIPQQIVTALSLGAERYAFGVSFGPAEIDLGAMAEMLRGLADTLRPLLRRLRDAEAIALNEQRFRLVTRATTDAVWDWDIAAATLWWNEGMQTQFGYRPADVQQTPQWWSERVAEDERQRVLDSLRAAVASGAAAWAEEYRFRKADGDFALVSDRGFMLTDPAGRPLRMIGCMVDITRQRQLEERARQSQRLDAVGQLTGGIAHDFNNLLAVIMGNAELLGEMIRHDPVLVEPVDMIFAAAERGADLSRRLLSFARLQPLDARPTDIGLLLAGMQDMVRRLIGAHIAVEFVPGDVLARVAIDGPQLENALLNLCINARDAMPDGGHLHVAMSVLPEGAPAPVPALADRQPCDYVAITVSDTGVGMAPEVLSRAFEPFFTTKPFGQGSGLGLSMVFGFVNQSNGYIDIASSPGQGTCVTLYLPRTAATPAEVAAAVMPAAQGDTLILLVEDDAALREVVTTQLKRLGYRVLAAESGQQALDILRRRADVGLLFTDVIMPGGMSGHQLVDKARLLRPSLPLLFTSGYPNSAPRRAGVSLLAKPYRLSELAAQLRRSLERQDATVG